jgi:hypothetical protein
MNLQLFVFVVHDLLEFFKKKSDYNENKSQVSQSFICRCEFKCKLEASHGCLVKSDSQTNILYISVQRQLLNATRRYQLLDVSSTSP